MSLQIQHFFHPASFTISYVIYDNETKRCAVIDPALDYDSIASAVNTKFAQRIINFIKEKKLLLDYILETHAHADHISSAFYIKKKLGGKICIGKDIVGIQKTFKTVFNLAKDFNTQGVQFDQLLNDGDELTLGEFKISVISTPGHTPDSLTYLIDNNAFIGDTLFMYDSGSARCDFPGGDAGLLYQSIQRIYSLADNTKLYMCHDYQPAGRELMFVSTVMEQKQKNIQIRADTSEQEYVEKREARDATLPNPKLIFPALQCNIQAGDLPPADNDEKHYFKTPISGLDNLE